LNEFLNWFDNFDDILASSLKISEKEEIPFQSVFSLRKKTLVASHWREGDLSTDCDQVLLSNS
jgi:hypothetical protein